MSVGARVREERLRLGLSQPAFAALAGATKGAQAKWEKDEASPNAKALIAWDTAGADATYILTGARRGEQRSTEKVEIEENITKLRRRLLDINGDDDEIFMRTLKLTGLALKAIIEFDAHLLDDDQKREAEMLLELTRNPDQLRARRIEEHVSQRSKREQARRRLADWFEGEAFHPGPEAMHILLTISLEYNVPAPLLSDLVGELHAQWSQPPFDSSQRAR